MAIACKGHDTGRPRSAGTSSNRRQRREAPRATRLQHTPWLSHNCWPAHLARAWLQKWTRRLERGGPARLAQRKARGSWLPRWLQPWRLRGGSVPAKRPAARRCRLRPAAAPHGRLGGPAQHGAPAGRAGAAALCMATDQLPAAATAQSRQQLRGPIAPARRPTCLRGLSRRDAGLGAASASSERENGGRARSSSAGLLGARPCCWVQLLSDRADDERGSRDEDGLMAVAGRRGALVSRGRRSEARKRSCELLTQQ